MTISCRGGGSVGPVADRRRRLARSLDRDVARVADRKPADMPLAVFGLMPFEAVVAEGEIPHVGGQNEAEHGRRARRTEEASAIKGGCASR